MKSRIKAAAEPYFEKAKPYFKNLLWLLMASVSSMTLYINSAKYGMPEKYKDVLVSKILFGRLFFHLKHAVKGIDVFSLLFIGVFYFLFSRAPKYKGSRVEKAVAAVFSGLAPLALILCKSYSKKGSWAYVLGSEGAVFLTLIKMLGCGMVIYALLSVLSNYAFNVNSAYYLKKPLSMKREIFGYGALFFVFWAPYMLLLYPGCFTPDAKDELAQLVGRYVNAWSARAIVLADESVLINTHHPVFYTEILNITLKFGALIHSYAIAFELLCIVQAAVLALSFAYCIAVMKKYGARQRFIMLSAAFFALNPLFPIYSMTVVKDTFFMAMMTLVIVLTYELLTAERITRGRLVAYAACVLVFIMTRNNGIYIMALMLVCILLFRLKDRKRTVKIASAALCSMLVFQIGIAGVIYPAMNISSGSPRELLSVPFTQTARYVHDYRDDISPEEEKAILGVLNGNLDEIGKSYDKELADSIKSQYCKYATSDDLKAYIKAWLTGLKKHPDSYIQAYLNLHYGWFSFGGNKQVTYANIGDKHIDTVIDGFDNYMGKEAPRDLVDYALELLMKNPLSGALLEMATYTWIYVLLILYGLMKKRRNALLAASAAYFNYLISFAGPVAYMRYTVPMVCALPFVIFTIFSKNEKPFTVENKNG